MNKEYTLLTAISSHVQNEGENIGAVPLFYAIVSNRSRNLENMFSDYDVYVICNFKTIPKQNHFLKLNEFNVDLIFFDYHNLKEEINIYNKNLRIFPSFSNQNSVKKNNKQKDYLQEILFEVICSPYIFDFGFYKANLEEIKASIYIRGILDYFYSRLSGNYFDFQRDGYISLVKFFRMYHSIWIIKSLLNSLTIPTFDIEKLSQLYSRNFDEFNFLLLFYRKFEKNEYAYLGIPLILKIYSKYIIFDNKKFPLVEELNREFDMITESLDQYTIHDETLR